MIQKQTPGEIAAESKQLLEELRKQVGKEPLKVEAVDNSDTTFTLVVEYSKGPTKRFQIQLPVPEDGRDGEDGIPGRDGVDGEDGVAGKDGRPGLQGKQGATGKPGKDGKPGRDGRDGKDGKDGAKGSEWFTGVTNPNGSLGTDKDFYLNVQNGDVYKKIGSSWVLKGNIAGPSGRLQGRAVGNIGIRSIVAGANVTVDNTDPLNPIVSASGGGGGAGGQSWKPAVPNESPNGVLTTFTTPETYIASSLCVYLNGLRESHFTELSSTTFQFSSAPFTGDEVTIFYRTV